MIRCVKLGAGWFFLLVIFLLVGHVNAAGMKIVPNVETGLFTITDDSAPLVKTAYIGWAANWAWDGAKINVAPAKGKSTPFTLRFNGLDVDVAGQWQAQASNRMTWQYDITFNKVKNKVIGAGIGFYLDLNSQVRQGSQEEPQLIEGNRGWTWQYKPGRTIKVSFEPAIAHVYFERGRKTTIRAMFIGENLKPGKQRVTMTIDLPKDAQVAPSLDHRYGPADTKNWFKQAMDPQKAFIDLSYLNEKPAGKHGPVQTVKDQDYFQFKDGTPIRFWGCNVQAYSLFLSNRELIRQHAKRIAQLGFNLVRLHHHDSAQWVSTCLIEKGETSQKISKKALDSYFWWIKCLKDEGIYVWVDLLVGRPFREGDKIPGWTEDLAKHAKKRGVEVKGFVYLNARLRELVKQFNEQLLTRKNPYTGLALREDPAVMGMLLTNENDLTNHFGNHFLPNKHHPYHQKLFEAKGDAFASKYQLDRNKLGRTWEPGISKLLLNDLEARFNLDMIAHLRSFGANAPIATCHQWGHNPLFSLPALTTGNVIDVHSYTNGEFLRTNPHHTLNFMHWIGAAQVVGKPLVITEYNVEARKHLNDAFTIPLSVSAMAAFQGWDAPMLYGYSQRALNGRDNTPWSSYTHPAIMGMMPAAAVMYRQGHVSPAEKTVVLAPSSNDLFSVSNSPLNSAAIRTTMEQHKLMIAMPTVRELPWLKPSPTIKNAIMITDFKQDLLPAGQEFIESDTGQIRRNWEQGVLTIDTPKSQAAIGWLKGKTIQLGATSFRIDTSKAAVVFTSLDEKPLRLSKRILLSATARVRTIERRAGYLSEPVAGQATLQSSIIGLKLTPLSSGDKNSAPTAIPYRHGAYVIDLPTHAKTHWFLLSP